MIIKNIRTVQDHDGNIIALTIVIDNRNETTYRIPCGKGTTMQELSDQLLGIMNNAA